VTIRFADCTLDLDARRLVRGGQEAHLPPKAFELLKLLVEHRPRVLSKTELIERVWPGVFVSDASLAKVVSKIRQAIGQEDDARIVRTVHGCGYAFAAELEERPGDNPGLAASSSASRSEGGRASCWLFCGRREFPLMDGEHVIGREPEAGIRLDSPKVSRRHAKVVVNGGRAVFIDLDSKNGSFVRGIPVTGPTTLVPGDDVRIGPFALLFRIADGAGSTESEVR
jgi:DNA-binding winged helix-turn-helix (wHTH) protein